MGSAHPNASVPLLEIPSLKDVFVSGIAEIEPLGANYRLVLYVDRPGMRGGDAEREAVAKIILPLDAFPRAVRQMLAVIGDNAMSITQGPSCARVS